MNTFPLTETLTGMMLERNENRSSTRYTQAFAYTFPKSIDAGRLVRAIEETAAANSIFQTRFTETDDGWRWHPARNAGVHLGKCGVPRERSGANVDGASRAVESMRRAVRAVPLVERSGPNVGPALGRKR